MFGREERLERLDIDTLLRRDHQPLPAKRGGQVISQQRGQMRHFLVDHPLVGADELGQV